MVTEADWDTWSDAGLSPYFDTVLEAFTPKRLMFGTDWPVVTLASSYRRWVDTVRVAIAQLSADERDWILAKTAIKAYRLATA
jgi:L-fuconolactonase